MSKLKVARDKYIKNQILFRNKVRELRKKEDSYPETIIHLGEIYDNTNLIIKNVEYGVKYLDMMLKRDINLSLIDRYVDVYDAGNNMLFEAYFWIDGISKKIVPLGLLERITTFKTLQDLAEDYRQAVRMIACQSIRISDAAFKLMTI